MASAEALRERAHAAVHAEIAKVVRKHEFVTLDIDIAPWGHVGRPKNELRAVVSGIVFLPSPEDIRWGEPHHITYTIVSHSKSGGAVPMRATPVKIKGTPALKEHIGVRDRGIPQHSRM